MPTVQNDLAYVSRILSKITSTHIQEVKFRVTSALVDPKDLDEIDWEAVGRTFERPNYSSLQKFVISGVWYRVLDKTRAWVQKRLPTLSERVIIEI
jgi:hypothetical protein